MFSWFLLSSLHPPVLLHPVQSPSLVEPPLEVELRGGEHRFQITLVHLQLLLEQRRRGESRALEVSGMAVRDSLLTGTASPQSGSAGDVRWTVPRGGGKMQCLHQMRSLRY